MASADASNCNANVGYEREPDHAFFRYVCDIEVTYPLAVFVPELGARSETFIRRHVQDLLPGGTLTLGGAPAADTVRDWDSTGPIVDLGAVSDLHTVERWLRGYGVRVILGEYLDASLPWLRLAQDLGLEFFVHAHGYDVSRRLREPHYRREYLRYGEAAGIITMSRLSGDRLVALGLPAARMHVIPYGVDVPEAPPPRNERECTRILAVGRMVPKKAPILVLDAFRRATEAVPQLRLDYVGTGPLMPAVVQFVKAFGLEGRVTLHGSLPNADAQNLMVSADIFLHHAMTDADTGDEEGLPVVVLEAMAAGLPVISTRHSGIPEAVDDEATGFLVAEGDTRAMGDRISQLARDRTLRLNMGTAGWNRASRRFSWSRERTELLRVLGLSVSESEPAMPTVGLSGPE